MLLVAIFIRAPHLLATITLEHFVTSIVNPKTTNVDVMAFKPMHPTWMVVRAHCIELSKEPCLYILLIPEAPVASSTVAKNLRLRLLPRQLNVRYPPYYHCIPL